MVLIDNEPSYVVERDDPMWRWVGSAHLPMKRDELLKLLNAKKQRCSSVVRLYFLFQNGIDWFCQDQLYIMPNKMDRLISDLSELSLTHTIVGINIPGMGVEVALVESEDHTSNIDAEVMEAIVETKSRRLS
jgi:hypothetical protein